MAKGDAQNSWLSLVINDGLKRLRDSPQLLITLGVALAIFGSFIFMADRFVGIAQDAQEQLIRTRIGSVHDVLALTIPRQYADRQAVREYMQQIMLLNPTITEFSIVMKGQDGWYVTLAHNEGREGEKVIGYDLLLSLASQDMQHSFTSEEGMNDARYFRTVRGLVDEGGNSLGVMVTRESLSEADRAIEGSVRTSIFTLFIILIFLLFLFFRHARIIDYTVLYRKLKEVDALKDDFVSMASHELRTPLSAIRGYISMLEDTELSSEQTTYMQRVDTSARELTQLIEDMLDVSRIEQGRIKMELATLNPSDVVQDAFQSLEVKAREKGLQYIHQSITGVRIQGDSARLKQVLVNIIGNAIKYTPSGGVRVEEGLVGGTYSIRVSDTGLGMDAEELSHLFEKFWRATSEDVRKQIGTGLGLWITKQLVEQMGGTLSVQSIKGVGTHFVCTFKVVTPHA